LTFEFTLVIRKLTKLFVITWNLYQFLALFLTFHPSHLTCHLHPWTPHCTQPVSLTRCAQPLVKCRCVSVQMLQQ